jgi:hypothetical protein
VRALFAALAFSATAVAQLENARIGVIDFYALHGLDQRQLRAALTVRRGDKLAWPATRDQIRDELAKAAGRPVSHFAPVCCDHDGLWMIYIGFGEKRQESSFRPRPRQLTRLSPALLTIYDDCVALLPEALKHAAGKADDYSRGYSLSSYPPMRALQLRMRESALANEEEILRAVAEAADDRHRAAASHLAGYCGQSSRQIEVLTDASRDLNDTVRNNATRALGVLAESPAIARQIPAAPFVEKLNSPIWSDRNKGLMLLTRLTRDRTPNVLAELRSKALPALVEMSQWQFAGHSGNAILLLGRIAGMDVAALEKLAEKGDAGPVLAALADLR